MYIYALLIPLQIYLQIYSITLVYNLYSTKTLRQIFLKVTYMFLHILLYNILKYNQKIYVQFFTINRFLLSTKILRTIIQFFLKREKLLNY